MRRNKAFDGTRESLMPRSHRPYTPHPNAHTPEELKWISDYHRRNPDISLCEMYGKLREEKGYLRHPGSLYRVFVRLGYRKSVPSTKKMGTDGKRFVFAYREQSSSSTVCFVKQAIDYFGYLPKVIQTDNGSEFTHTKPTKMIHPFDRLCAKLGIHHKLIRPRTPWHNGKVERSHRNDQERFYDFLRFCSFEDLQLQLRRFLYRSNNIPMAAFFF